MLIASLAAGAELCHAQSVNYMVYTLTVGDSSASLANGVMFDGQFIWLGIRNPDGGVIVKMTTSGAVLSTTPVGVDPDEMAFDGTNVWMTDFLGNDVAIVDPNGNLVKTIPLAPSTNPAGPANPEGIVFDGHSMWVANDGPYANVVTKIDVSTQGIVGTYAVGRAPDAMGFDGTHIWVGNSNSNSVWLLDPDTGAIWNGFATGTFPSDMVYDGANMWVGNGPAANVGIGSVTKIRAADGLIIGNYQVGNQVRGLADDGTSIWVCNEGSSSVTRLRASNAAVMGTFATGLQPRGVVFDGSKIWISNSGENTLTIIAPPGATVGQPLAAAPSVTVTQTTPVPATIVSQWLDFIINN